MRKKCLRWAVSAIAASVLLTACVDAAPSASGAGPTAPTTAAPSSVAPSAVTPSRGSTGPRDLDEPPPVTVRFFDESIELPAWTYCYGNVCADGAPPANPPDVGDPGQVVVEFPIPGWSFTATFSPAVERCGRLQRVALEPTSDRSSVLRPAGYAGTYDVTLFGKGNGDLFTTFRWATPTDGPLPRPKARLAVLAGHDGQTDSYGVELGVTNLVRTPTRASATITVQARGGESIAFKAKRSRMHCRPEGSLYWDGPDDKGLAAADLGERPFTYKVELILDGERHVARSTWPKDEIRGNEPSVPLDFTPNLPALPQ